jgi:hypothetical protein
LPEDWFLVETFLTDGIEPWFISYVIQSYSDNNYYDYILTISGVGEEYLLGHFKLNGQMSHETLLPSTEMLAYHKKWL